MVKIVKSWFHDVRGRNIYWRELRTWLIAFATIAIVVLLFLNIGKVRELGETNKQLIEQTKLLSEDNQKLSLQNTRLAEQNQQYQRCNFLAFARFTRDGIPIPDEQIDNCVALNSATTSPSQPAPSNQTNNPPNDTNSQPEPVEPSANNPPPPPPEEPPSPPPEPPIVGCLPLIPICI